MPRVPEVRRRAHLGDVVGERARHDPLDVGVGTLRPIQLKSITDGSTVQIFRAYGIISRSAMPSPNIARIHCS